MTGEVMTPHHARLTLAGLRVRYLCQADNEGAAFAARALARLPQGKTGEVRAALEVRAAREALEAAGILDRAGALLPSGLGLAFQVGQAVTAGEALPGLPVER